MKFNKDPPTEYHGEEFPSFNKVVNVSSCYYYLSLMERFVSFTQGLSEAELKRFLVRAESRYFKWLMGRTFEKFNKPVPPPLDVAYFWHAHMLSPLRYLEDIERLFHNSGKLSHSLPLKEIHESRNGPSQDTLSKWREIMGSDEPYELSKGTIFNAQDTFISCTMCHIKAKVTWGEFTEWRIDRTVAFKCHFCEAEYSTKHLGKVNLALDIDRNLHIAGFVLNRENKYDPYNTELVETKTGTLAPSSKITSLPLDAGLDAIDKIIEANQNQPEFLGLNYRKAGDRLDLIETIKSTYFCTPYRSSIDLIMAVARQYKFALKVTREVKWDLPQDIVAAIRSYPSFLRLVKMDPHKITVPTIENDLAWHTHMLHPAAYIQFNRNSFQFFLNHDDTIADTTLEESVEETFDRHRRADIAEKTNWELNLMTRRDKIRKFFGKLDRNFYRPRNHFPEDYNEGRYEAPRVKTSRFSSTTTLRVSFEMKHSSVHNRRESMYLLPMSYSEEILSKEFQETKTSKFGFIGTSSCGGTNQSLRPSLNGNYIPEEEEEANSYRKVFTTKGPVPELATHTKKEIFKKMQTKEKSSTEEEIYEWAETYHALGTESAQGKKFYDWVTMHHEYLTDDILRQVQVLNKKIQGPMAISLSCYAPPKNPYTAAQIKKDMNSLRIAKKRDNDIDKDYESETTDFSKTTNTTAPTATTTTTTTTTTLKQANKGRKKKWSQNDSGYASNSSSMNFFSIQTIMNSDASNFHSSGHHHSSNCGGGGHSHSNCGGGGHSSCGGGSSSCGGGGGF